MTNKATPEDYKHIFEENIIGQKVFDDLVNIFGRVPSKSNGIDRVLDNFEYAGRRKVIEFIATKINQANGVENESTVDVSGNE